MSRLIHRRRLAGHRGSGLVTSLGVPGAFRKQAAEFKIQGWSATPHFAGLCKYYWKQWTSTFPARPWWLNYSPQMTAGGRPWWCMRGGVLQWQTEVLCHNNMKWVHLQCVGGRIQKMRFFTVILHTHHVIHTTYVQEMGRDEEDLRSFTIAYPY